MNPGRKKSKAAYKSTLTNGLNRELSAAGNTSMDTLHIYETKYYMNTCINSFINKSHREETLTPIMTKST